MDPSVNNIFTIQAHILLAVNPQSTVFLVVFLFILLLLSFITSGAEVALFSLQSKDVNVLKTKQHAAARRITSLLEERKAVYTSLLIAGGVFNISIIILSNFLLSSVLHFGVAEVFIPLDIDMLIKIVAIAFVIVFFWKDAAKSVGCAKYFTFCLQRFLCCGSFAFAFKKNQFADGGRCRPDQ